MHDEIYTFTVHAIIKKIKIEKSETSCCII